MLKFRFFSLMLLALINVMGIAIPYPILSPLILKGDLPGLLNFSPLMSVMLILSLYPLGQFLGSPILGSYSDKLGSRKILTLSMSLTSVGYLLSAFAIYKSDILLFCFTRFFTGFAEGNFSVLRAEVARLSKSSEERLRYFGYLNSSAGLAWLLGPIIGAVLSNKNIVPWFAPEVPFFFGGLLGALGVFLVLLFLSKDKQKSEAKDSLLTSLKSVWKLPGISTLLFLSFCISLAVDGFYEFFPSFLVDTLGADSTVIAQNNIILTSSMILSQIFVVPRLKIKRSSFFVLAMIFAFGILGLTTGKTPLIISLSFALSGLGVGSLVTLVSASISDRVPEEKQGSVLGSMDSLRNLGDTLICIGFGLLGSFSLYLPLFLITIVMVVAAEGFGRRVEEIRS